MLTVPDTIAKVPFALICYLLDKLWKQCEARGGEGNSGEIRGNGIISDPEQLSCLWNLKSTCLIVKIAVLTACPMGLKSVTYATRMSTFYNPHYLLYFIELFTGNLNKCQ